ncbi:MAG: hypothetical protein ACLPN6_02475 [Streptosporangiaceae bacterium]
MDERPDDRSGDSQEEDGPAASGVSAASYDDHLAATNSDDHGGDGKPAGFRLAPGPDLSDLASQPRFPSLILPGLDFSGITLALSAIASKAVTGSWIIPELDLRGLVPQLDYTSFLPKIDLLPPMVPDFSAILPKSQFPWAERLSDILRPLRERLPPNWPGDIDLGQVQAVIQDDGLPLVWVPRAEIVTSLLAAPDRAARVEVLLAHEQEITADCHTVLGSVSHETLSGQLPLAVKALEAFEAGHHEAAQALAAAVTETAVTHALGNYKKARQRAAFDPGKVTLRQLRVQAALAPIGPFYTAWSPSSGTPAPEALSRHVTIHQADQRHYTRGNAAVAVLLTTSVLRALQELAEESPDDSGT